MSALPRPAANLFPLLVAGILAALSYWLEVASRAPEARPDGKLRHDPDTIVENFEVRRFDALGFLQHTLTAARMVHYPDDDTAVIVSPRLTLHRPPPTTVEARTAQIASRGEQIVLLDEVRVTRSGLEGKPDTVLTTTRMDIWPETEIARTTAPVTITQGASQVHGEGGLSIDQKNLIYVLEGPVTGTFFSSSRAPEAAPAMRTLLPSQPAANKARAKKTRKSTAKKR